MRDSSSKLLSALGRWARPRPRKVFVDCGSNTCKVLAERIERGLETEFFAFEPQPDLAACVDEIRSRYPATPIHFFDRAVWVHDGTLDFYLATEWGPNYRGGSTLLAGHVKNAAKVDYAHPMTVKCIDFSRWIRRNFSPRDHLVVKMDIEGAEYPVLEKMMAEGTIDYIAELIVEFHWQMNENLSQERHDALRKALDRRVLVSEWH
ncbi:MAG: FkbM family methyltransferase [Thermoanaerobaculia bacterium]